MQQVDVQRVKPRFRRLPSTARGARIYAIGDVHGRFDLFSELIQAIEHDNARRGPSSTESRVLVLGDFIDRGPDSRRLIRLLMSVQQRSDRLVVLLGNHEATLLDCVAGDGEAQRAWMKFGGLQTLESFGIDPPREDEDALSFAERLAEGLSNEVVEWLSELPLFDRSGDYFFCHAGVRPGVSLERQRRDDLLWIRREFLDSDRGHGAVVVHGHTISDAVEVTETRIGIDTGAYRTGTLSAVGVEGDALWIMATEPALELKSEDAVNPAA